MIKLCKYILADIQSCMLPRSSRLNAMLESKGHVSLRKATKGIAEFYITISDLNGVVTMAH